MLSAIFPCSVQSYKQPSPAGEGGPRQRWMRSCLALMTPHPSAFGCHLPPLGKAFLYYRKLRKTDLAVCIVWVQKKHRQASNRERQLAAFLYTLKAHLFFLTSTAFVSTNVKYGIPLLRYTVFLKAVLQGTTLNLRFFYFTPNFSHFKIFLIISNCALCGKAFSISKSGLRLME